MRKGFTLLELLSVMAIMGIISTIAIMGYFAVMRGVGARSAAEHLSQVVLLARQSAIMQGKKTYVIFDQDETNSWYSVCRYEGVVTGSFNQWMFDDFADWSDPENQKRFMGATIFNLSSIPFRYGMVMDASDNKLMALEYVTSNNFFSVGDVYGWELYPPVSLPRGMQFTKNLNVVIPPIIFKPDGSAQNFVEIEIYEKIKLSGFPSCTIQVEPTTGFVTVDLAPGT